MKTPDEEVYGVKGENHWRTRDRKLTKRRGSGMVVSNRSIFTINEILGQKAREAKETRKRHKAFGGLAK